MTERDLNDLQAELRARGAVEASARPPRRHIVQLVFLLLWPVPVIGGVVMLVFLRDEPTGTLTGTVPAAYSDGNERAWVRPLTESGSAWVEGLDDGARRLFQPAFRRGLLSGRISVGASRFEHVRLVPMQCVAFDDWRAVVEEARQRFTRS